jgi:hypothetical protein
MTLDNFLQVSNLSRAARIVHVPSCRSSRGPCGSGNAALIMEPRDSPCCLEPQASSTGPFSTRGRATCERGTQILKAEAIHRGAQTTRHLTVGAAVQCDAAPVLPQDASGLELRDREVQTSEDSVATVINAVRKSPLALPLSHAVFAVDTQVKVETCSDAQTQAGSVAVRCAHVEVQSEGIFPELLSGRESCDLAVQLGIGDMVTRSQGRPTNAAPLVVGVDKVVQIDEQDSSLAGDASCPDATMHRFRSQFTSDLQVLDFRSNFWRFDVHVRAGARLHAHAFERVDTHDSFVRSLPPRKRCPPNVPLQPSRPHTRRPHLIWPKLQQIRHACTP